VMSKAEMMSNCSAVAAAYAAIHPPITHPSV
jgi:hypothetical protein